jgi:hypothetical protein
MTATYQGLLRQLDSLPSSHNWCGGVCKLYHWRRVSDQHALPSVGLSQLIVELRKHTSLGQESVGQTVEFSLHKDAPLHVCTL